MNMIARHRLAIAYFLLFTINALSTSVIAALSGNSWSNIDGTSRFIIICAIIGNWTGTIMAFINKSFAGAKDTGLPLEPADQGEPPTTEKK